MATITCPECNNRLKITEGQAGRKIRCSCGELVPVPEDDETGEVERKRPKSRKKRNEKSNDMLFRFGLIGGVAAAVLSVVLIGVFLVVRHQSPDKVAARKKAAEERAREAEKKEPWDRSYVAFIEQIKSRGSRVKTDLVDRPHWVSNPPEQTLAFMTATGNPQGGIAAGPFGVNQFGTGKDNARPQVSWEGVFESIEPAGKGHLVHFDLETEVKSQHTYSSDREGAALYRIRFNAEDADLAAWKAIKPGDKVAFTGELRTLIIVKGATGGLFYQVTIVFSRVKPRS